MSPTGPQSDARSALAMPSGSGFEAWRPQLQGLCAELAVLLQGTLAVGSGKGPALDRAAAQGLGDVTFGIDIPAEAAVAAWHEEIARATPLSVMTEDNGWRHLIPDGKGGFTNTNSFDHGGPRIAFDPIDGTRNFMANMRSAWTVISFAGPGPGQPRFSEMLGGMVAELPTTREFLRRVLWAERGGSCTQEEWSVQSGKQTDSRILEVDQDNRADNGYFPFFRYQASLRPAVAQLEADFLGRLLSEEGADEGTLFDDQYITNAGQMVLLAFGTYRVIVDPRPVVAARLGMSTTTAKPYDVAGAFLVAEAAGAVVTDLAGDPLDFPMDCSTPVAFAGWANRPTFERLLPHLTFALQRVQAP